jgi:hypothetical protein
MGLTIDNGQLMTSIPGSEVIKPLKRLVRDIAAKEVNSRSFNKTKQMVDYVQGFGKAERPDLTKRRAPLAVEGLQKKEFAKTATVAVKRRKRSVSERVNVVPKSCPRGWDKPGLQPDPDASNGTSAMADGRCRPPFGTLERFFSRSLLSTS